LTVKSLRTRSRFIFSAQGGVDGANAVEHLLGRQAQGPAPFLQSTLAAAGTGPGVGHEFEWREGFGAFLRVAVHVSENRGHQGGAIVGAAVRLALAFRQRQKSLGAQALDLRVGKAEIEAGKGPAL
jgi:hypothetical protein